MSGDTIINIDNCGHTLESDFLCQALTQQRLKIRVLGHSRQVETPINAAIYATGNNLVIASDLVRRSLLCAIDAKCERPELRHFDFNVVETIHANRGRLVAAALTVLRAWHAAGEPSLAEPYGSFEDWSRRIREPLIWLGHADPCESVAKVRDNDPARTALAGVLMHWKEVFGVNKRRTVQQVLSAALVNSDLHSALVAVAGNQSGLLISSERLGRWLQQGRRQDRQRSQIDTGWKRAWPLALEATSFVRVCEGSPPCLVNA